MWVSGLVGEWAAQVASWSAAWSEDSLTQGTAGWAGLGQLDQDGLAQPVRDDEGEAVA